MAGTPNTATRELKAFLAEVFATAFKSPAFKKRLVRQIVLMTVDTNLLKTLLAYHAGVPTAQVDHTHTGKITLEQLVAGTVPADPEDGA